MLMCEQLVFWEAPVKVDEHAGSLRLAGRLSIYIEPTCSKAARIGRLVALVCHKQYTSSALR